MNNDIFEIELSSVVAVIDYFLTMANSFNHAKSVYSSSYLSNGPATVKKISNKYNFDNDYSAVASSFSNLLMVCKGYLSSCIELEKGLSDQQMGELDQYILANIRDAQGLLEAIDLYDVETVDNLLTNYSMKYGLGGYPLPKGRFFPNRSTANDINTGGYFALGFKYNPNMITSQNDYNYARRTYKILYSPRERAGRALDNVLYMISRGGYIHNSKTTITSPTLQKAMSSYDISCSGVSNGCYHDIGCLDLGVIFKHALDKNKPGGKPPTNDPNSRFEGITGLKNGTLIHYYKDGENYKINRKGLHSSLKIIEVKVDDFPKYDDIESKYKVKGASYIYNSHMAMNTGPITKNGKHYQDAMLSLTHHDGYQYTIDEAIKTNHNNDYVYTEGVYDIFIPD